MEILKEILIPNSSLPKMVKIKDLIYFDGPLLSHFQSDYAEDYLFYWVDRDNEYNRWLVFRTSQKLIELYLQKSKSLFDLIADKNIGTVYKVDIDNDLKFNNLSIIEFNNIPNSYLPDSNSYYNFTTKPSQDKLKEISVNENTGILQAYYNESSKIGKGYIDLEILGASLNDFSNINKGIRKAFIQKEKAHFNKSKVRGISDNTAKFDESALIQASSFFYFGHTAASFGVLFKPASMQSNLPNIISLEDRYMEFFVGFFKDSENKKTFIENIKLIDKSVIDSYKKLLSTIRKSKIQFNINYQNSTSNFNISKEISFSEANNILNIIDDLEYDESKDIYLTGRFTALNLKTGHYNFETVSKEDKLAENSSGYLDQDRKEMSWQIKWNKLYNVVISRKESKKTGRKKASVSDTLVSFIEIDEKLSEI